MGAVSRLSRLFVALWPPDDVVAALEELHRKDQPGVRFVPPENWHVTLRFLGDAPVEAVADALGAIPQASLEPTVVRLGPAVDLGRDARTLFVPASGADDLAAAVVRATRELGTEPVRRRFLGHVTIARMKRRTQHVNMPRALGSLIDASWRPSEIALVESTLRPDGARYHTVATWPLDR